MTSKLNFNYKPSYIVDKVPTKYGGNQEDYLKQAEEAIQSASDKITTCREKGGDLKKLFFEIIADLSAIRAKIAKEHGTKNADDFGKRRDEYYPGRNSYLVLFKPYEECNQKILTLFSKYIKEMEEAPGKFKKELEIEDVCQGRKSKLKIEVLTPQELSDRGYAKPTESYAQEHVSYSVKELSSEENWTKEKIKEGRAQFRQFKNKFPGKYQTWRMSGAVQRLNQLCPSPTQLRIDPRSVRSTYPKDEADSILGNMKSLFVIATLRTEIDKKMYAITQYITWMYENEEWVKYKNPTEHPVERMKLCSKVMLYHQDEFLIDPTLQEISKIFEAAVSWNKEKQSLQDLKDMMFLIVHLATHNIRDVRGTAAENEWLESAVYRSLNVTVTKDQAKQMLD